MSDECKHSQTLEYVIFYKFNEELVHASFWHHVIQKRHLEKIDVPWYWHFWSLLMSGFESYDVKIMLKKRTQSPVD